MELTRAQRIYLGAVFAWLLFITVALVVVTWTSPNAHAVIGMGTGLILLWVVLCGSLMWRFRDPIRRYVEKIPLDWRVKFVLFCTLLAMVEEAITTTMTNCAPLFGVPIGRAFITASTNYIDVICLHSVVIFVSFFVGWAVLLRYYDFSPFAVFVLFGITGTLAEMGFGGLQHILEYGMWSYVYGLMVWLPARCVPKDRGARRPPWWLYPIATIAPYPFLILFPLAGIAGVLYPHHPKFHFPPIQPDKPARVSPARHTALPAFWSIHDGGRHALPCVQAEGAQHFTVGVSRGS